MVYRMTAGELIMGYGIIVVGLLLFLFPLIKWPYPAVLVFQPAIIWALYQQHKNRMPEVQER